MSFTFKGVPLPSYVKITNIGTNVLPPFSLSTALIDDVEGSRFLRKREESKVFSFSYLIQAETPEDLKVKIREFASFLSSEKPEPLVLDIESDKTYLVMLTGDTEIDQTYTVGTGEFEFVAFDPYAYGEEKTVELMSGGTLLVDNPSTAPSYPIVTATAIIDNAQFRISRGDKVIEEYDPVVRLNDAFKIGDTIVINMEEGKVTVNGALKMPIIQLDSDFFHLSPGPNWVNCVTGYTVTMTYTERWK